MVGQTNEAKMCSRVRIPVGSLRCDAVARAFWDAQNWEIRAGNEEVERGCQAGVTIAQSGHENERVGNGCRAVMDRGSTDPEPLRVVDGRPVMALRTPFGRRGVSRSRV